MKERDELHSPEESMQLIERMIHTAKQEQKDDGKGWILWGWLLFLASVFTYVNLQLHWVNNFFFWNTFGLISVALLLFGFCRLLFGRKKQQVKTYTQELFKKLNIGFTISLVLIIFSMNVFSDENISVHPTRGFALLLGLYGFWILIYGAVLSFRPSVIGAYICWAFAFASLFVRDFGVTMLFHAAAVLCGYIIPGYIAKREFNNIKGG
jgi:hypothetical protein